MKKAKSFAFVRKVSVKLFFLAEVLSQRIVVKSGISFSHFYFPHPLLTPTTTSAMMAPRINRPMKDMSRLIFLHQRALWY